MHVSDYIHEGKLTNSYVGEVNNCLYCLWRVDTPYLILKAKCCLGKPVYTSIHEQPFV